MGELGNVEVSLSDLTIERPETLLGLLGKLNVTLKDASGKNIYSGGVTIIPHGEGQEYHENGELKYEGGFLDGKYNGSGSQFNEEGKKVTKGVFVEGELSGDICKKWFDNGQPEFEGGMKDGKRTGLCKAYHENGYLKNFGQFTDDVRSGDQSMEFYENGYLMKMGRMIDGEFCPDVCYEFDDAGYCTKYPTVAEEEKEALTIYTKVEEDFNDHEFKHRSLYFCLTDDPDKPYTLFHNDNVETTQVTIPGCEGEETGLNEVKYECKFPAMFVNCHYMESHNDNNEVIYKGEVKNGKFNGQGELFKENVLCYRGNFVNGKFECEAECIFFHLSGNNKYVGAFKEGQFCGEGKQFSDITQICIFEGTFENGQKKTGKEFYDSVLDGAEGPTQFYSGDYNAAELRECETGQEYYENGNLKYEGRFVSGYWRSECELTTTEVRTQIGVDDLKEVEDIFATEAQIPEQVMDIGITDWEVWGTSEDFKTVWVGFFEQGGESQNMKFQNMRLNFDGTLTGEGSDVVGVFSIAGTVNDDRSVEFVKQYEGAHALTYKGNLENDTLKGTWHYGDEMTGNFEMVMVTQDWEGFFVYESDKSDMKLSLYCDEHGIFGFGSDDVGLFLVKGDYNSAISQIKFAKKYLGQHTVMYTGRASWNDSKVVVKGKWQIPDNCEGTFELSGKIGKPGTMTSILTGDEDLDFEVTMSEKGKAYYEESGRLKYEGEFLDNEFTGYGILYNDDEESTVRYHGMLEMGVYHGVFGKLYDDSKTLIYKGQFNQGNYIGRGAVYDENNSLIKYKGQLLDGIWEGEGTEYFESSQKKYKGNFKQGVYFGWGELYDAKNRMIFRGVFGEGATFENGEAIWYAKVDPDAEDSEEYKMYVGHIEQEKYNGEGTLSYPNSMIKYKGTLQNNNYDGVGEFFTDAGVLVYSGDWVQNAKHGESGTLYDETDGHKIYAGSFDNDCYVKGTLFFENGFPKYTGEFQANLPEGSDGKLFTAEEENRVLQEGEFIGSELNCSAGAKVYYDEQDGPVLYEGGYGNGAYQGVGVIYYRNGMKQTEGNFNDGNIIDNSGGYYYETGVKMYEGNIVDGAFTGENVTLYHENGSLKYQGPMENSQQHGDPGKAYHPRGGDDDDDAGPKLKYEGGWKDGCYHGDASVLYHENGNKAYEGPYVEGKQNGRATKHYDEEGRLSYEGDVVDGLFEGLGKTQNEDGSVAFDGVFKVGHPASGCAMQYYDDAREHIMYEGNVSDGGVKEGFGVFYWENGNKKYQGEFVQDQYCNDGDVAAILFYENGEKEYEGSFKDNQKNGQGVSYVVNENGEYHLVYKGNFENDLPNGEGKFYYTKEQSVNPELQKLADDNNEDPTSGLSVKYHGQVKDGIEAEMGTMFFASGKIMYEGIFVAGIWEGAGKQFYETEKLKYEGPFIAGKFDGSGGKLYYASGNLQYEGDFKDGVFCGDGNLYFESGTKGYEGQFVNQQPEGHGILFDGKGNKKYEGDFIMGKFEGNGSLFSETGQKKYSGAFFDSKYTGIGTLFGTKENTIYEGEFSAGQINSENAIVYYDSGNIKYKGSIQNGKYQGNGELYYTCGKMQYAGPFVDGKFDGPDGVMYFESGIMGYQGGFRGGNPHGDGTFYDAKGNKKYEGKFNMGLFNGQGKLYYENGQVKYEGEFAMSKFHGEGVQYDQNGVEIFTGIFKNGSAIKD